MHHAMMGCGRVVGELSLVGCSKQLGMCARKQKHIRPHARPRRASATAHLRTGSGGVEHRGMQ